MPNSAQGAPSGRILLVEDSRTQAFLTRAVLQGAHHVVQISATGAAALSDVQTFQPDLILLDMHLPDFSGREVARMLKASPDTRSIPIIFLTGVFKEVADIISGLEDGADDYLIKPVQGEELVARVNAALRARQTQRELARLTGLLRTVHQLGTELTAILDLESLLESTARLIQQHLGFTWVLVYRWIEHELTLVALSGPDCPTLEVARGQLPRLTDTSEHRVLAAGTVSTCQPGEPSLSKGLLPDAQSCLLLPLRSRGKTNGLVVLAERSPLELNVSLGEALETLAGILGISIHNAQLYREMELLATIDALTGLYNRRTLLSALEKEWSRAIRYQRPLAAMSMDVDFFKHVNDRYGHQEGDRALQLVSQVIQRSLRQTDVAGRLGGDEFVVILPETALEGAMQVAERMEALIRAQPLVALNGTVIQLGLSIGVASWPEAQADQPSQLLKASDDALYRAKVAGRGRASA